MQFQWCWSIWKYVLPALPPLAPHILFSDPHLDGMRFSTALKWHPYIVFVHQVLLELVIPCPLSSASIKDNINNNNNNSNNNILSYLCRIETVWKINMVLSVKSLHNYWMPENQICIIAFNELVARKRMCLYPDFWKTSPTNPFYSTERQVQYFSTKKVISGLTLFLSGKSYSYYWLCYNLYL